MDATRPRRLRWIRRAAGTWPRVLFQFVPEPKTTMADPEGNEFCVG